ncbi:hypothetical protein OSTOST_01434 [Ostertagia ostertagi]
MKWKFLTRRFSSRTCQNVEKLIAKPAFNCEPKMTKVVNDVDGYFKYKCVTGGRRGWDVNIVACVMKDGTEIEAGTQKTIGEAVMDCRKEADGITVTLSSSPAENASCEGHKPGEEWLHADIFKVRCGQYGKWQFLGCVVDGTFYKDGETFQIAREDMKCWNQKDGNKDHYRLSPVE